MAGSDTKVKHMEGVGSTGSGRARLRGLTIYQTASGAGRITLTDGSGGTTLFDQDIPAGTISQFTEITIPGEGILFDSDIHVATKTNWSSVNVFWS
tara:strand:+ start:671 stop:958 length:288 start_codon:yes stop_codon:yes gene_type:complete